MRRTGLLTVVLLVVSACGGVEGGPVAESTTAAAEYTTVPSTTRPSTTTTVSSTTTRPSTTTTTVPPWTTLPDVEEPPPPVLQGGLSEGAVESMCLEVTTGGSAPPDEEQVVEKLTAGLLDLGVSVSSEGCEATLRLSLSGRRSSATYQQTGECWSGVRVTGETTLFLEDQWRAAWSFAVDEEPPFSISWCPDADDPIDWYWYGHELWHDPFYEMFGNLANLRNWHHGSVRDGPWPCWDGSIPPTEEEVARLAFLFAEQGEWIATFIDTCVPAEYGSVLLPLVPYLVALDRSYLPGLDHDGLLAWITGQSFESPEQAWAWWEQQQG